MGNRTPVGRKAGRICLMLVCLEGGGRGGREKSYTGSESIGVGVGRYRR